MHLNKSMLMMRMLMMRWIKKGQLGLRRKKRYYDGSTSSPQKHASKFSFLFSLFIIIAISFTGCSSAKYYSYNPQTKIAPDKLKEDFFLLKKILEADHPSIYWYTPKDSIDIYFNEVMYSINDSLTEFQFRAKVAWFIAKLKCGHTSVRGSKAYNEYFSTHESNKFPLLFKVWSDSLVVLGNLNRNDSFFRRGTVVTSVDGHTNHELLDSMFQFISTDGYAIILKTRLQVSTSRCTTVLRFL